MESSASQTGEAQEKEIASFFGNWPSGKLLPHSDARLFQKTGRLALPKWVQWLEFMLEPVFVGFPHNIRPGMPGWNAANCPIHTPRHSGGKNGEAFKWRVAPVCVDCSI